METMHLAELANLYSVTIAWLATIIAVYKKS